MDTGCPRLDFNTRTGGSIYGPGVDDFGTIVWKIKGFHFSGPGIKLFSIYESVGHWTVDYEQVTIFPWVKTPVSIYGPGVRVLRS
jgi:hypothetical protein